MTESQNQKIDELLSKVKTLGSRVKEVRSSFGEPIMDRILSRANKNLARFGDGNGVQTQPPPQPQEPKLVCPKCGKIFLEDVPFCSGCAFPFLEEKHRRQREDDERQRLERFSKMGVKF